MPSIVNQDDKYYKAKRLLLGCLSGTMVSVFTQPLEVIKTTILVNPLQNHLLETTGQFKSVYVSSRIIWEYGDAGWKNFFRGSSIACLRQSIGFGIYSFLTQEFIDLIKDNSITSYNKYLGFSFCAGFAKIIAMAITTPLVLIKTRKEILTSENKSIFEITQNIIAKENFSGLFKGMSSLIYRETVYSFFHYGIYRYLKDKFLLKKQQQQAENESQSSNDDNLSNLLYTLIPSISAGVIAILISHPFEVIRNRLQSDREAMNETKRYNNIIDAIKKIYLHEGNKGFMKGLVPRLLRRPITSGITWMTYDMLMNSQFMKN